MTSFDPAVYADEYRAAVEKIIEDKAAGRELVFEDVLEPRGTVIDLAAALEASLKEAREARERHPSVTSTATTTSKAGGAKQGPRRRPEAEEAEDRGPKKKKVRRARKSA